MQIISTEIFVSVLLWDSFCRLIKETLQNYQDSLKTAACKIHLFGKFFPKIASLS